MASDFRALWAAFTLLTSAVIGMSGGVLSWLGGVSAPNAILAGAGAFAGSVILILTIMHFLWHDK